MRFFYPRARVAIGAVFENYGESRDLQVFETTPLSINVRRNSYKQADSWSIEFDAKDFPIPPALVRTGNVEIYIWDAKAVSSDFKVPQAFKCSPVQGVEPAICGILDDVSMEFSADGRVVRMDGQDYTALFIEHQFKQKRTIVGDRLDRVLAGMIRDVDKANVMSLSIELPDSFGKTQAARLAKLPNIGKAAGITNRKRGFPVKRGDSYWDIMYKLSLSAGFILYVRGLEVVLTTPQRLNEKNTTRRKFFFSWGENLESLNISRKMGKERVPQIEIRAYDDEKRRTNVVTFPARKQKVTTGVGTKRNETLINTVYGIRDKDQLAILAETLYNLLAGAEQKVKVTTRDLVDSADANIINIKSGDAVYVKFLPFNNEALDKLPSGQRAQWLVDRGFSPQAARVIQQSYEQKNLFNKPFYVREAELSWSSDDGLEVSLEMANFVTPGGVQESGETKGAAEV